MGDAGPFPAESQLQQHHGTTGLNGDDEPSTPPREIHVLVTGFGPFRSFLVNPSWLIATDLASHLDPESAPTRSALKQHVEEEQPPSSAGSNNDDNDNDTAVAAQRRPVQPYKITVHTYPTALRVSYNLVRQLVPQLIADPDRDPESNPESQTDSSAPTPTLTPTPDPAFHPPPNGFDFVLHIGMAAGRDNYTLETQAHRDHYKLKDIEDTDGRAGESHWKHLGMPEVLEVGWNKEDVLARWEALVRRREDDYELAELLKAGWRGIGVGENGGMTLVESAKLRAQVFYGKGKRAVVKLSRDAGRYLCEYIFYTGLGTRWREAQSDRHRPDEGRHESTCEKLGKVAFLHVPGGTSKHDVARGVRVAESAILALVDSWEAGFRNPDVHPGDAQKESQGRQHPRDINVSSGMYELKGTGDQ